MEEISSNVAHLKIPENLICDYNIYYYNENESGYPSTRNLTIVDDDEVYAVTPASLIQDYYLNTLIGKHFNNNVTIFFGLSFL